MQNTADTGVPHRTRLDPPAADPAVVYREVRSEAGQTVGGV
jgi:hypothetical protein